MLNNQICTPFYNAAHKCVQNKLNSKLILIKPIISEVIWFTLNKDYLFLFVSLTSSWFQLTAIDKWKKMEHDSDITENRMYL